MRPFRLSRTKFIAAFVRNNDLFSTLAASRLGLKMSLFLTQAAMNFVLERRNGRKRSIQIENKYFLYHTWKILDIAFHISVAF